MSIFNILSIFLAFHIWAAMTLHQKGGNPFGDELPTVQADHATGADVQPDPATAAGAPPTLSLLRRFLGAHNKTTVAHAVVETMPVVSAKGTKSVMIDNLLEYIEGGGHDENIRYCKESLQSGVLLNGLQKTVCRG